MICPKCGKDIDDNTTVCPYCRKVVALRCPNCGQVGESPVCEKCGYTILVKCSKCSKTNPSEKETCTKCGFSLATSLAYQECESDEYAALVIKFLSLKQIRKILKSTELYIKFCNRLKNLLYAQLKGVDCKLIVYGDTYVLNFCKELSFGTSANKATRLGLKILNAFVSVNNNLIEEFSLPLNLQITVLKKQAEQLQILPTTETNMKLLTVKKNEPKYLKGFQLVIDQYVRDDVYKEFKTDSLFSVECDGSTIMYYEVILPSYILPPSENTDENSLVAEAKKINKVTDSDIEKELYSFKVFDINAKCTFEHFPAIELRQKLGSVDFVTGGKIIGLRSGREQGVRLSELREYFLDKDLKVLSVVCTEAMQYRPWGFFLSLLKDFLGLSFHNMLNDLSTLNPELVKICRPFIDLLYGKTVKATSAEDARYAYFEHCSKFLSLLKGYVIIIENFEKMDDTSIQALELYFDKFKHVKPNFVFTTSSENSLHSKFKGLLRTNLYYDFKLAKTTMEQCLSLIKADASDFIQSFHFEQIKDKFNGSLLYFKNIVEYLKTISVLIEFENKLIVKTTKTVVIPKDLNSLFRAKIKLLNKNQNVSLILAYSSILGERIDFATLMLLGVNDIEQSAKMLVEQGLATLKGEIIYINHYDIVLEVMEASIKPEIGSYLAKNVVAQLGKGLDDTTMLIAMGKIGSHKEQYLTLWKNSQFAIKSGDYDAYLKNCLGFLSLIDLISTNIKPEVIEQSKKEVYNNILMFLYAYSPVKIYFIENILLMDAINNGEEEKIVKLSNLMLQGALISSNYSDALGLLHNILSRMKDATLIVDGAVNTKFLLLSLVNIEILYNLGSFSQCVEIAEDILTVLSQDVLEKVKPVSFSTNMFVTHVQETLRLVAFAKLYLGHNDLEDFCSKISIVLNAELPEKDAVLAIRDFLSGKVYNIGNVENSSPLSKVIFLILQEFSKLKDDYKTFAQNIYQAKLLASDIHQYEMELLCDVIIAYAYFKIGIIPKAMAIYEDVLGIAEKSALFNIIVITKYLMAKLLMTTSDLDRALILVNDALALINTYLEKDVILYIMLEKLYIELLQLQKKEQHIIDDELLQLVNYKGLYNRLLPE